MASIESIHPGVEVKQETMHASAHTASVLCSDYAAEQADCGEVGIEENKENVNKDLQEQNGENHEENQDSPVIDIVISNVVCTFNLRCHINLKRLAMEGAHVEYKRSQGILNMKMRRPFVTANITSSGKVTVTGSTSEAEAKVAARRVARRLQKLGFNVRFFNFRVVNVLGTCSLPFGIKLNSFSSMHPQEASYEPELHPGVTYRIKTPKATLKVFSTGSITITAPCVENVGLAVEHIYPLVSEHQMEKRVKAPKKSKAQHHRSLNHHHAAQVANGFYDYDDDDELDDDDLDELDDELFDSEYESFDSDVSHD